MAFKRSGKKFNRSDRRRHFLDVDNHGDRDGAGPEVIKEAYLSSPNPAQFSFGDGVTDSPFSVGIWFNVSSFEPTMGYRILVGKFDFNGISGQPPLPNTGHTTRANEWLLTLSTANTSFNGGIFMYDIDRPRQDFSPTDIFYGGGNSGSQLRKYTNTSNYVQLGKWHHFCATYDANTDFGPAPTTRFDHDNLVRSGLELYFDGVNVGGVNSRTAFYTAMSSRAAPLSIASGTDSGSVSSSQGTTNFPHFGSGKLTDCAVFNKALSASEVAELYSAGQGFDMQEFSDSSSIISHFPLGNGDSITGGVFHDVIGGLHASPVGADVATGLSVLVERI